MVYLGCQKLVGVGITGEGEVSVVRAVLICTVGNNGGVARNGVNKASLEDGREGTSEVWLRSTEVGVKRVVVAELEVILEVPNGLAGVERGR